MGRRAKSPKVKADTKRARVTTPAKNEGSRVHDLEKRLEEAQEQLQTRDRELAEAREQLTATHAQVTESHHRQTATSEILRVIGSSPRDLQPVFDIIAKRATELTDAVYSAVYLIEGEWIHLHAWYSHGIENTDQFAASFPMPITSETLIAGTLRTGTLANIGDMEDIRVPEAGRLLARTLGVRSTLAVPMRRDGHPIGAIGVNRREAHEFTPGEIALLQSFADQAVIAIENVRLFNETKEALERQTATAEILRVISSSPTDAQPVFDAILRSAVTLCNSLLGNVVRVDGDLVRLVATLHPRPEEVAAIYPAPLTASLPPCRAIRENTVIHVPDVEAAGAIPPAGLQVTRAAGIRSLLVVPMRRDEQPIGAILIARPAVGPFPDEQIALLQTFADQAVIAIENVRLFTELQEKNRALTQAHAQVSEALARQTATADILRAISQSPTDVQPVFDTIVQSAARLCYANTTAVFLTDGHVLYHPANYGSSREVRAAIRANFPRPLDKETISGAAILTRSVVQVPDIEEPSVTEFARRVGRGAGFRSMLSVPMLRQGKAVGAINVTRPEPGSFSDAEVALLQTFADQAVIAIENVRLFKELETRNRDLTEALDRQTSTAEILSIISRAQTDLQPVFDAITESATRLCGGTFGALARTDGERIFMGALYPTWPTWPEEAQQRASQGYPRPLDSSSLFGRAMLDRRIVHVPDLQDPAAPQSGGVSRAAGARSQLTVPMLRDGQPIGAITVTRSQPGAFTDAHIALLRTFADQAVIAIENARLLTELRARTAELTRSVGELRALGEVGRAVSSTLDLETVLTTIVSRAVQLSGLDGGVVFEYDEAAEEFVQRVATESAGPLAEARRATRIRKGEGVVGRTASTLEPARVPDITLSGAYEGRLRETLIAAGVRAVLAVPMLRENHLIGCLAVTRNAPGDFPAETIELLRTFATQSALAIQNARLFREIEQKSRQLEVVSQHKSEFLANMSHELRTPLNAIIGFSEVLTDRMFGELNEKQEEYLKDIYASGTHLLSLINDILDLSKIEAGRMELELTDFDLPTALDNALMLVRERAQRRNLTLHKDVDAGLGQIRADERKIRQVVLNLLSNAIKFTPEGGRIEVAAVPRDGLVEVSVSDTGVGIAPEDQQAVFEEFRQVGTADKKAEGTGLGLTLCRKFIELHGGKIWVKSQPGAGSTFTFTIPLRQGE
jgi:two-component system, NtrC family, sensor kinase